MTDNNPSNLPKLTDDNVTRLKKKRGVVRACITKNINKIETELSKSEIDIEDLEETLEYLVENSNEMKILDSELEQIIDPKDLETDLKTVLEYKEKITKWKFKANKKLRQLSSANENRIHPNTSFVNEVKTQEKVNIKLPKLSINKFYGDLSQWLSFWNSFESAIHQNESLDKISKLNYLKAYLGGTALNSIEGFSITSENYDSAIELLISRFGRKEILINTHMNNILSISPLKNSNDVRAFRKLYDNIQTETRSLESLGIKSETYSNMLCPMLLKMLPADLVLEFNKSVQSSEYAIKDLIEFLLNQLVARERSLLSVRERPQEFRERPHDLKHRPRDSFSTTRRPPFAGGGDRNEKTKSTAADLLSSEMSEKKHSVCVFCNGNGKHQSSDCEFARTLSLEGRKAILSKRAACFKCFKIGHLSRNCNVNISCNHCGKRHSSFMCYLNNKNNESKEEFSNERNDNSESSVLTNSSCSKVYLQTLIVNINAKDSNHFIRAIIDTGSSRSYISKYAVNALKLRDVGEEIVTHGLFGGVVKNEEHKRYVVNLSNIDKSNSVELEVMDQRKICSSIPKLNNLKLLSELKGSGIFLSDICLNENCCLYEKEPDEINLLLGADSAGKLFTGEIKHLSDGLLAMNTKLGWTIMGQFGIPETTKSNVLLTLLNKNMDISEYWSLDTIGIRDPVEKKSRLDIEIAAKEHFLNTVSREPDGRYIVSLPWIEDHPPLADCRTIAEKRLGNCIKQLERTGRLKEYEEVFENWREEGIIEEVPPSKKSSEEHFLPHRPVFKENSTTKVRPVFDGSARQKNFPSLNDCLEKGPNLIELIPSIINRFRFKEFGVTADIQKAFLQIALQENDRPFLKFLWWEHGNKEKLRIFQHKRVVFGISSSPFLLGVTLEYHLDNAPPHLQDTAQKLKKSFYVDNCVLSLENEEELRRFIIESQELLSSAKFHLRGWEHTPTSLTPRVSSNDEKIVPVLGLNWKPENDTLSLDLKGLSEEQNATITKRKMLSAVHRIFDPIGFTGPITLKPKLLLQECWKQGLTWDSELPPLMSQKFQHWWKELKTLKNLEIPRYLMKDSTPKANLSFHVFCDASKTAYAACVFLRIEDENSVNCQLVQARNRVAPLKTTSIPRLELLSCTIAARLAHNTKREMDLEDVPAIYWSDSINALYWIRGSENWGTFVYNRVQDIRKLTNIADWRHIAGQLNPADLPSRGCNPEDLVRKRWWEGPSWLKKPQNDWPISKALPDLEVVNAEKRKSIVSATNMENDFLQYTTRISSYRKIIGVTAWIFRFASNSMKKREERKFDKLSIEETDEAEKCIIKMIQNSYFDEDKKKNLKLQIFQDPKGLLRVNTRISMRQDSECFRYPALLPSKDNIVHKLIFEKHLELDHAGLQILMSNLRENFWIIKSRKTIRQVILSCVTCRKFSSKPLEVPSAPLPEDRIKDASVFEVDLCGPFYLKKGTKSWAVLFTCAVYRAVHLELVTSLSTDNFILALRRFISRRGRPSKIYSDNGTNLVGTSNELKAVDWNKITNFCESKRINWKFNPPSAPWWGGFWERLIGLVKRLLRRILGNACLHYEELATVLCDVEGIINSRPLTYLSEEVEDLVALTPAMFLQDIKEIGVPDLDQIDAKKLKKRFTYKQRLREDLRRRFRIEYLGQLKEFYKNKESKIKEGDVVLIGDSNLRRHQWPMARVLRLFPGKDGKIRVVQLKTQTGTLLRPVQRLYPIEMSEQDRVLVQPVVPESSPDPDPDPEVVRRSRYGRILRQRKVDS